MMRRELIMVAAFAASVISLDAQINKEIITYGEQKVIQIADTSALKLDSTITYTSGGKTWNLHNKVAYQYDAKNNLSEALTQVYSNNGWINKKKTDYTYAKNGDSWSLVDFDWEETQAWKNVARKDFKQSGNAGKVDILYQEWSDSVQWLNVWKQEQNYNGVGRLLSYETVEWNGTEGQWQSYWDYNCFYDDNGNLVQTSQKSFDGESGTWHDEWEAISDFDSGNGNKTSEQIIDYNLKNAEWDNVQRSHSDYPEANTVINVLEKWDTDQASWMDAQKTTEVYNNIGKPVETRVEYWDGNNNDWQFNRREVTTYDEHGLKKASDVYLWDKASGEWQNQMKTEYYYSRVETAVDESPSFHPYLHIYPNPVESQMSIGFNSEEAKALKIFDLRGVLVKSIPQPTKGQTINVSELRPGIYVVVLQLKDGIAETKFVKR